MASSMHIPYRIPQRWERSPSPPPRPYSPPYEMTSQRPYLKYIDRTNRGLGRYDLTSFFSHPDALPSFTKDIIKYFKLEEKPVDAIVGIDSLGFPIAGALACTLQVGCILARKKGKIPLPKDELVQSGSISDYMVVRGETDAKGLEIREDLLREGMRVIVVDEWIDTGAQMTALCEMLEEEGVVVRGVATLQLREGKHPDADKVWEQWDVFAANRSPLVSERE